MEAPERLYLSKTIYSTYLYQVPDPDDKSTVEYIRTDVVVKKAVDYLLTHIPDMHILGGSCRLDECIIKDFMQCITEIS